MEKKDISNNLLYSQKHFDLLFKLYRYSFVDSNSQEDIYNIITETAVEGLNIDRAGFWKIDGEKLVCINLFDRDSKKHILDNDILSRDFPNYFKALQEGIAIVADDAKTNEYTYELKDKYLIPLGITDMLDLPIRDNGQLIGVLCCEHRDDPRTWSDVDLAFARSIADILSLMKEQNKRRIIEKKLIESERKLSLITETSKDVFIVLENSKVTYASPAYAKSFGFTEEEVLNMTPEDIFTNMHPDDVENVKSIVYKNLDKKEEHFKYEFRVKNKKGRYFWREDTASVVYGAEGLYSTYIVISRDISYIKDSENKIKKLYAISKSQNEKLLDFTHIISHNIRSNTSNMTMLIDLIDEAENESESAEYFQLLKESNSKLSETIFHLNETINVQLSTKEKLVDLNLKSQIEKTLTGINGIIKKEKAEIIIDIPSDMRIKIIPSYFESIMFNLITNAIKYRSKELDPVINIKALKTDTKCCITVSDNGIGIDMNRNKDKIFGMYKTFHGNNDAVGLGLFMTKNHVEALGGTIEVESELGKGTQFKLVLNA